MRTHHKIALVLTMPWVTLLAYDFGHRVATGTGTWVTDGDLIEQEWLALLGSVGIGAMFASLAWVVRGERDSFAHAPRPARWARRPLLFSLVALAAGLGLLTPLQSALGIDSGIVYDVSGLVAFLMVITLSVSALVVGLASLRSRAMGWGGRILALILPAVVIGVGASLLAGTAPTPVFGTSIAIIGLATLGIGAGPRAQEPATV